MGDRSTITITSERFPAAITFYGHWSGGQNLEAVRNVMSRTSRIGDESFLSAQIFAEFTKLGGYDGELGFGIFALYYDEWENPPVIVNADTGAVSVGCRGAALTEGDECREFVSLDTWDAESGLCLDCSNEYYDHSNEDND